MVLHLSVTLLTQTKQQQQQQQQKKKQTNKKIQGQTGIGMFCIVS